MIDTKVGKGEVGGETVAGEGLGIAEVDHSTSLGSQKVHRFVTIAARKA